MSGTIQISKVFFLFLHSNYFIGDENKPTKRCLEIMAETKPIVTADEFSALDADEQALYKKRGDSEYILDVAGIRNALTHERNNFDTFKKEVEPLLAFKGLDASKVKNLLEKDESERQKQKLKEQGFEETLAQTQLAAKEAQDKLNQEWQQKHDGVLNNLKTETLKNYLTANGVLADRAKYALADLNDLVDLDISDNGIALKKKGGIGDAKELEAIIGGLKEKSPFFFAPNGASGSGASGSEGNGGGTGGTNRSAMTVAEKSAYVAKHGQEAYNKLPN